MGYRSFEDLPVWNTAIDLAADLFALTGSGAVDGYAGLRNQIERATISISNNIAEGYERGTHDELITFLYYALGSAGEVRSMLHLIRRLPVGNGLQPQVDGLFASAKSVSRQLSAWIEALKNGAKRSPRHENDTTRSARASAVRREAFLQELERVKNQGKCPPQGPDSC